MREKPNVYVFGTNLYGGPAGKGYGRDQNSYFIPVKDAELVRLPLDAIQFHVDKFLAYARNHLDLTFRITPLGTPDYDHAVMARMFQGAPHNCQIPMEWHDFVRTDPAPVVATSDVSHETSEPTCQDQDAASEP